MAKQSGILKLRGTIGGLTFYKLDGQYYVRSKSSLDRRRVTTDPAFARSRVCSQVFGQASRIAKHIYQQLPTAKKKCYPIGRLTAAAGKLLWAGNTIPEAAELLSNHYLGASAIALLALRFAAGTGSIPAASRCLEQPRLLMQASVVGEPRTGFG